MDNVAENFDRLDNDDIGTRQRREASDSDSDSDSVW
jgi:hypothetical protein